MSFLTPIKQSYEERDYCLVCGEIAKEKRIVENIKCVGETGKSLRELLNDYGGINIESGTACRNCLRRVETLHEKSVGFYNDCQKNSKGRRNTSPHLLPQERRNKSAPKRLCYDHVENVKKTSDSFSRNNQASEYEKTDEDEPALEILDLQPLSFKNLRLDSSKDSCSIVSPSLISPAGDHIYGKKPVTTTVRKLNNQTLPQATDHDYIKSQPAPRLADPVVSEIIDFTKKIKSKALEPLSFSEAEKMTEIIKTENKRQIAESLMNLDGMKIAVLQVLMNEINKTACTLRNRKLFYVSELMKKSLNDLKDFNWNDVVNELLNKFPSVFSIILSLILSPADMENSVNLQKVLPRIGTVYSILMQGRNNELSRMQRVTSLFLFDNICDQKVFDRLQPLGVCLSYDRSLDMVDLIGGHFDDKIVELVKEKSRFRLIGDNINWTIGVHDQRLDNKTKMLHAFGSAVIVQNVNFDHLDVKTPQISYLEAPVQLFIPSEEDYNHIIHDYTILMSYVVFKHIPYFEKFKAVVPQNISKPCSQELKKKSEVIPLPVLFKNEQYYQDVVQILEFYETTLGNAYRKAGKDIDNVKVHIGGDQLTRVRFSGAKALRAHHLHPDDKFDHLSPITFELFHMLMSFLKMTMRTLYKKESGQNVGTLKSFQDRLSRRNIGDNINEHYESNKDFFISVTDIYIVECFLEYFGMKDIYDAPNKNMPPEFDDDLDMMKTWYFEVVECIIRQHIFQKPESEMSNQNIEVDGQAFSIVLESGKTVTLMRKVTSKPSKQDCILNYSNTILQLGLLFKDLINMIHLPDRFRGLRLLKLTMLYFKSYNNLSKYALEILRLLTHQICTLSEKAANEEFYALFVNTSGKFDTHFPADRRMEYLVKEVKKHVKHMYSNKTESNISHRTRAIAVIHEIGENFDKQSKVIIRSKKHSDKEAIHDELEMLKDLRALRPFNNEPGRCHTEFESMPISFVNNFNVDHYHNWINTRKEQFALEKGN